MNHFSLYFTFLILHVWFLRSYVDGDESDEEDYYAQDGLFEAEPDPDLEEEMSARATSTNFSYSHSGYSFAPSLDVSAAQDDSILQDESEQQNDGMTDDSAGSTYVQSFYPSFPASPAAATCIEWKQIYL